ncbi:MAG: multicopper oxidase family protein [Beijerinckiaceae bacterium]|nr:multicopper oxidase family protein [Beijerinckiaceae bacterium]
MKLDRRTFLEGLALQGLALTSLPPILAPSSARAQSGAQSGALVDGFQIVRARPVSGSTTGRVSYAEDDAPLVLRIRKGEELKARLVNGLEAPTTIHWRGVRGPNAMDGTGLVQKPVNGGESFDYRFTPPDAGTFIFHAHAEPTFATQVQRGLAGVLIVEDPAAQTVDHDLVAALADRPANDAEAGLCARIPTAAIIYTSRQMAGEGLMGSVVTCNGRPAPESHSFAPRARVRLRLANLATSRLMALSFDGAQPSVVAVDGQNCAPFEPLRNMLPLAPGGRFDVIFDMPAQEGARVQVSLLGAAADAPANGAVLSFVSQGAAVEARPPVADPQRNPLLPEAIALQRAHRADLKLEARPGGESAAMCPGQAPAIWHINGKPGHTGLRLFGVKRGTPVSLGFTNASEAHIVMRVHGHAMRQLHLMDDGWDPYWRDAVVVPAGRTVRVAFVADNPGRWRIGGGILPQALGGLAGFFEVS